MIIGLTGDVGAGKSTVRKIWEELGASVFDADALARSLWEVPEIQRKAEKRWGKGFFDTDIKNTYPKIAEKIFNDEAEYEFVRSLLQPKTASRLKKLAAAEQKKNPFVVLEVPLLFENGLDKFCDLTVYVSASQRSRAERNKKRGWTLKEIKRREARLLPRKEKASRADFVLKNNGDLKAWRDKALELGNKLLEAAGGK